jgi:hypothetical protein
MRQEFLDVNPLVLKNHADDEAISVSLDIENGEWPYHVPRRKRFANVLQVAPLGIDRGIKPNLKRGFGIGELCCSLEEPALADPIHQLETSKLLGWVQAICQEELRMAISRRPLVWPVLVTPVSH